MPSSYTLGRHFEAFVKRQLESGRYNNASEVIRDALRLMEDRERMVALAAMHPSGLDETGGGQPYRPEPRRNVSQGGASESRFQDLHGMLSEATNGRKLSVDDMNAAIAEAGAKAGQP